METVVATWRTMAITDRRRLGLTPQASSEEIVATMTAYAVALADAGVSALQVREYDLSDGLLRRCVASVVEATAPYGLPVLVNDRAHVAVVAGAAGIHLRSSSMPARRVRDTMEASCLVGRSVHDRRDLAPDEMDGVNYVVFGTVFSSGSKPPGHEVAGLARLEACCVEAGRPVLAVGGVTVETCRWVAERGASGVAGIALFVDAWTQGHGALRDVVAAVHDALNRTGAAQ